MIVQKPEDYQWSSHRAYIEGAEYSWLNRILILDAFGGQSKGGIERLSLYVQMNDEEAGKETVEIRKSVRSGVYGDSEFLEQWCPILNEGKNLADSHPTGIGKVTVKVIIEAVCSHLNTTMEDVRSEKRSKQLVQARMIMAGLTHKLKAGSMADLGKQISRDPTYLAKLARKGALNVQVSRNHG